MTEADRTITSLMILRIMSSTKGRISVKQIFDEIQPTMGISIRSLQRYLNGLANWGLVEKDGQTPQGFRLSKSARELFAEIAFWKISMTSISLAEYKNLYGSKSKNARKSKSPCRDKQIESKGELILGLQLKAHRIEFEREFKFHPKRKWRADFHLIGKKILIEVEGGIWVGGRHTRGKGYIGDMEKYNAATMMGYQVIRFSIEQVKSGLAIKQIEMMIGE